MMSDCFTCKHRRKRIMDLFGRNVPVVDCELPNEIDDEDYDKFSYYLCHGNCSDYMKDDELELS